VNLPRFAGFALNLRSLRFRLLLASTVVEIVMLALLLANSVRLINDAMLTSADNAIEQMVPTLNVIAASSLVTGDLATLQDNLNAIVGKREQGLAYVVIDDIDGERVLAGNVRAAFLKPLFLVMVMTKFHVQIQNQPINQEWDERLSRVSNKFRELTDKISGYRPAPALAPAPSIST
jgi:hypothetical protein